jgi:type IV secretory pathway VirB10-like protein
MQDRPGHQQSTGDPARPAARPAYTGPISSAGPLHPILEGTIIDTVLTNRLDGSASAPVNCLVTNPVFSHDGRNVLIPAGSRSRSRRQRGSLRGFGGQP